MPSVITTIRAATEVDAVNTMLGAIGEAPLAANTDLSVTTDANVEMAIGILKETVREVLAAGWRFNTLTGYELSPTATYAWVDTDAVTTTLNVFKVPVDFLSWSQTPCPEMNGIELIERLSLKYTEASAKVMVLFDRVKNRDGAEASLFPRLYLDVIFAADFANMPECARRFATVVAARRLCQRSPASDMQAGFQKSDELTAFRVLKREQGLSKQLNLFDTADAYEMSGRRQRLGGGYSTRVYPGGS